MSGTSRSRIHGRWDYDGGPPRESVDIVLEMARAQDAGDPFAFRFDKQSYLLRQQGGVYESAVFPWDAAVLDDLGALQPPRNDVVARQRMGARLREFLEGAHWDRIEEQIAAAVATGGRVNLTVRSSAAELTALPWELLTLRATGQHVGELPQCLVRYEWPGTRTAPPQPDPPVAGGRILLAWSAAGGSVPAVEHHAAIRRACRAGDYPWAAEDELAHVSLSRLYQALEAPGPPVSVLHIVCHGGARGRDGATYGLIWNGASGDDTTDFIDPGTLRHVLARHAGTLRMVVLCACHGGNVGTPGNHLGSVAQALHRVGIPVVVASRAPLSAAGSVVLAETLYWRLLVDLTSVEDAFVDVRQRLLRARTNLDWAVVQMYGRWGPEPAGQGAGRGADRGASRGGWPGAPAPAVLPARTVVQHRPLVVRPYRGLSPYTAAQRRFFFGRDREIAALISTLRSGQRTLFVVGASGSGKSSLVLAGLLPQVREGAWGPDPVAVCVLRPGVRPCRALAKAFAALSNAGGEGDIAADTAALTQPLTEPFIQTFTQTLMESADALSDYVETQRDAHWAAGTRVLLVIDQFEELFTTARDPAEVVAFINNVLAASARPGDQQSQSSSDSIIVVATLRADFLAQCLDGVLGRRLGERIQQSMNLVLPMDVDQLRTAIVAPAARVGLTIDSAVVSALLEQLQVDRGQAAVGQIGAGAGNLPLLSFALDALWERRQGDTIGWAAWDAIGGLRGAIARRADEVLAGCESAEERRLVRDIFGRLVVLGQGTEDTRRYATLAEIEALDLHDDAGQPGETAVDHQADGQADGQGTRRHRIRDELQRWITARLLVADEDEVWVAHEALFRAWGTLRDWLDEEREALMVQQDIVRATRRWHIHGRTADDLWRGGRLRRAQELRASADMRLTNDELAFLTAAETAEHTAREVAEAQRQREFLLSEQARASTRQARIASLVAGVRELLARHEPKWAARLLLAMEVSDFSVRWQWEWIALARSVLTASPLMAVFDEHRRGVRMAAFSPDGTLIATASNDGTARIWPVDGGVPTVLSGHTHGVRKVAFSPDGRYLATASWDGTARIWPIRGDNDDGGDGDGDSVRPLILRGHTDRVHAAEFSPDSGRVITASDDGTARIWTLPRGWLGTRASDPGVGDDANVETAAGAKTAAETAAATAIVLRGHDGPVYAASFAPDGARVVTGSQDKTARVWRADGRGVPVVLVGHRSDVVVATFAPDGARLVTASYDASARVWQVPKALTASTGTGDGDPSESAEVTCTVLSEHRHEVVAAAFSPDSKRLVTASVDRSARIWHLYDDDDYEPAVVLSGHARVVYAAAFSPDGTQVVTASHDQTARIWRADGSGAPVILGDESGEPHPRHRATGHSGEIYSAAFSPDGVRVVTASEDGSARLWRAAGGAGPALLSGHLAVVHAASFSPDGTHVLTASGDGRARLWRTDGGAMPYVLALHGAAIATAVFSPDGARVLTASADATARVWYLAGGEATVLRGHKAPLSVAAFSPDGALVVTASLDGTARIWSADGSGTARPLLGHDKAVIETQFSPDGELVVTASLDGTARVWSGARGDAIAVLAGPSGAPLHTVAWSPDGTQIVAGAEDGGVQIWHLSGAGGDARCELLQGHSGAIYAASFSQGGEHVLTASADGTARLWRVDESEPAVAFIGHSDIVRSAELSPDGSQVLTASADGSARLWPADGTAEPLLLDEHRRGLRTARYSPDGMRVVTASDDGTARLWLIGMPTLSQTLRDTYGTGVPAALRRRYLAEVEDPEDGDGDGDPHGE